MRRYAIILFIFMVFFLLGSVFFLPGLYNYGRLNDDGMANINETFKIKTLNKKDLRTYRELEGTLEYDNNTGISANGTGVLTYVPKEGDYLGRGQVLLRVFKPHDSADVLSWKQQFASTKASVSQAELALENLNKPATAAQIASADANVAQAELALENLNKPTTAAQIASADASVAQAEANVITADGRIDVRHTSRQTARKLFCDKAALIGFRQWIYSASLCPADDSAITNEAINTLLESLF